MYVNTGNSQPVVQDSGSAAGGGVGVGLNEIGLTIRGSGSPPYANAGKGPSGTNLCDYDAPVTSATGYHYLCIGPNAQGGGLLTYGAAGTATALPFQTKINGVLVPFPSFSGKISSTGTGPVTLGFPNAPVTYTFPSVSDMILGLTDFPTCLNALTFNGTIFSCNTLAGTGTVTSVGLTLPLYTISNSPVTSFGTLTGALQSQTANTLLGGPTSGSPAAPTFRNLVGADFSTQSANAVLVGPTSGGAATPTFRALVAADLPSPIVGNQNANVVYAGPASGSAAPPAFRALVPADVTYQSALSGAVQQTVTSRLQKINLVTDFGASGSLTATTAATTATNATVTIASAQDFQNGQGVRCDACGSSYTLNAPTTLAVTPHGATGSTSYSYTISAFDFAGGVGAALISVQITNGNATLSSTNYNAVTWSAPTGTAPAGYIVYGRVSGSLVFLGITPGTQWLDFGGLAQRQPDFVPTTPSASDVADALVTKILSGGGTTALTLAVAPSKTIGASPGAIFSHDDTAAINTAITDAAAAGKSVEFPATSAAYPISGKITIPDAASTEIHGVGRKSSTIIAELPMGAMMDKSTTFWRGGSIEEITLDGNGIASRNIWFEGGDNYVLRALNLFSASFANLQIGNGTSNAQNFNVSDISMNSERPNQIVDCLSLSCLPFTNLFMQGINNQIYSVVATNATYSNFSEDTVTAGNYYVADHGYNFPASVAGSYNMSLAGAESSVADFEGDGALSADVYISGFMNSLVGSYLQYDGLSGTMVGVVLSSGATGNVVHSNRTNGATAANSVVNSSGGAFNSVCNNLNFSGSVFALSTYTNLCN